MKIISKFTICSFLIFNFVFSSSAQTSLQKNSITLGAGVQVGNGLGLRPSLYLNFEQNFTSKSSIEVGIHYLNIRATTVINNNLTNTNYDYYHLLSMPILYKFKSNILDIAAGPSLNLIKAPSKGSNSIINFQKTPGKLSIGYVFKLSKSIGLNESLFLVPEIGVMGNQYLKKPQTGLNIGLKYRF